MHRPHQIKFCAVVKKAVLVGGRYAFESKKACPAGKCKGKPQLCNRGRKPFNFRMTQKARPTGIRCSLAEITGGNITVITHNSYYHCSGEN